MFSENRLIIGRRGSTAITDPYQDEHRLVRVETHRDFSEGADADCEDDPFEGAFRKSSSAVIRPSQISRVSPGTVISPFEIRPPLSPLTEERWEESRCSSTRMCEAAK